MKGETAFRLIASGFLEDVADNHRAVCDGDPVALHRMRIALTRLRAAISFYSAMVEDSEWKRLKSELKWLNGYLGATRDLDVAIENSHGSFAHLIQTARIPSQRRLRAALLSARYRRWFEDMSDWIEHGPWSTRQDPRSAKRREAPASHYHARKLRRWRKELVRRSRDLQDMGKRKLHRIRLASKRLRYAIEFSKGALSKDDFAAWRPVMKRLRNGQQILGEINDAEMFRSLAAHLAPATEQAPVRGRKASKTRDRMKAGQLLRQAAGVYRKLEHH